MIQTAAVATREEIAYAYALVLGRQADTPGLDYFTQLASSQGLSAHQVALLLTQSDEFRNRTDGSHEPVEITRDGYHFFVRASDRDIGGAITRGIEFEPHVTALVKREVARGDTVLDVGANTGYFTMLAAHLVGETGRVVAVEPMDKNVQLIYLGIQRNGFKHVDVFPFGASEQSGLVPIITDPNTSNALVQHAPSTQQPACHAAVRTLDWMCRDLARLDFIKIDIEGHELFAWRGATKTLSRFKPQIVTEFHPHAMKHNSGVDSAEYLAVLFGYAQQVNAVLTAETVVPCSTHEEVMRIWQENDQRHGGHGTSHLDLQISPRN